MQCRGLGKITLIEYTKCQWGNDRYGGGYGMLILWVYDLCLLLSKWIDSRFLPSLVVRIPRRIFFLLTHLSPRFTFSSSYFSSFTSHTYFIVHIQLLYLAPYLSVYLTLGVLILLSCICWYWFPGFFLFLFLGFTTFISISV